MQSQKDTKVFFEVQQKYEKKNLCFFFKSDLKQEKEFRDLLKAELFLKNNHLTLKIYSHEDRISQEESLLPGVANIDFTFCYPDDGKIVEIKNACQENNMPFFSHFKREICNRKRRKLFLSPLPYKTSLRYEFDFMNFLPLVLIFLMIFSAVSFSFMQSQFLDKGEKTAMLGSIHAMRAAYNHCEELHHKARIKIHQKDTPSNSKNPPSPRKPKDNTQEKYFRLQWMHSLEGAIDLAPLIFQNAKNYELLLDSASRYLERIYAKASFIQDLNNSNWARPFLLSLIDEQKRNYHQNKSFLPLADLHPQTDIKTSFHKLIRGTNTWELLKQHGYPPLEYCICFKYPHKNPIAFSIINPILLEVLFGKAQASKICELEMEKKEQLKQNQENKKKSHLNREELSQVLKQQDAFDLLDLVHFQRPQAKKIANKATDHQSNISECVTSCEVIQLISKEAAPLSQTQE